MTLFLMCIKIFFSRILDVSLGTLRMIYTVQGSKRTASVIGFFEVLIWFLVVRNAFNSSESGLILAVAYAGGYAAGTYTGGFLADKFIKGTVDVQVVTAGRDDALIEAIHREGFAVSAVNVNESEFSGEKYMLFAEVNASSLEQFRQVVYEYEPGAFITVHETKHVYNGFIK